MQSNLILVILAILGLGPLPVSHAQLSGTVSLSSVTTTTSSNRTIVSIAGDGGLGRAQTWQDSEGYHVVVPNAVARDSIKTGRGIRIRRVGRSIEILVQTRPGTNVTVQDYDNSLSLSIEGKLQPRSDTDSSIGSSEEASLFEEPWRSRQTPQNLVNGLRTGEGNVIGPQLSIDRSTLAIEESSSNREHPTADPAQPLSSTNTTPSAVENKGLVPASDEPAATRPTGNDTAATSGSTVTISGEEGGFFSSIFSGTSVLVVLALGLFGLVISWKLRSKESGVEVVAGDLDDEMDIDVAHSIEDSNGAWQNSSRNTSLAKTGGSMRDGGALSRQTKSMVRLPVSTPATLFGAYRIDQEVGKLIGGQPHRMDVLSSRATDDRRAIENSLIKILASPDADDNARRRAREALEEYGFVARQCAALLLAPDAFDRTYAARCLGDIKSAAALPFLLEGLYDSESIVRNQAVVSIGELKVPAAIGALLDMARRHPDVPTSLIGRALSSCSVEGLDFFDAIPEPALLSAASGNGFANQMTSHHPTPVEDLPESSSEPEFISAIYKVESIDIEERSEAVKALAQYQVQRSVTALSKRASCDSEPSVRALAISSLGTINHESVFPAVLIGMADETREVRAAAARSLSRLSFDRADAFARVMETADEEMLQEIAKACIKAGIVGQNIDRLASCDRRQTYEAFSLFSLMAKANMIETILAAITDHPNKDVRVAAIHLLANTGQPEVYEELRQLTVKEGVSEALKTELLEAMYKLEQNRNKTEESAEAFLYRAESIPEAPQGDALTIAEPIIEPVFTPGFEPQFEPKPDR